MDVKNTEEVIDLLNETLIFTVKTIKEGIKEKKQSGENPLKHDFEAFYEKLVNDQEYKTLIKKAYEGSDKIVEEIKDISTLETIGLAYHEFKALKSIIAAFAD